MSRLDPLFDPRGVIVAGASAHPGKFGFVTLHNILRCGYAGRVFPVSLEGGEVLGVPVVTRVGGSVRAPGTLPSHYAPRAQVVLVEEAGREDAARTHAQRGERVALLTLPPDAARAARSLYATLRDLDAEGYDTIVATLPADTEANAAVRDRLTRAAAPR